MTSTSVNMIHSLYEDRGEGSPSNPVKFKGQDFKQLKETLLGQGKKFEDETFPANLNSLGKLEDFTSEQLSEVEWLRPRDLNPGAVFVVDGGFKVRLQTRRSWKLLVSFIYWSVDSSQAVDGLRIKASRINTLGFSASRFGKWVDVVVDDLLPTRNKVPESVSSRSGKEFWAPLMEKAYAKICGSYGDMINGNPPEAFKDFSGGVHMTHTLAKSPSNLWDVMNTAVECKTMMGCGTYTEEKGKEIFKKFGLVEGHAFAVTGIKQVASNETKVKLMRIWNPWGEKEWNGDWCDKSEKWNTVSTEERDQCLYVRNDGEFWMEMKDFCLYYEEMDICCDSPNFVDSDPNCKWNCSQKESSWVVGQSAGGSDYFTEGFWTNPQYRLTVKSMEYQGDKNILLSLLQKPNEEHGSKVKYHAVGFVIFQVPSEAPRGRLPFSLFKEAKPLKVSEFSQSRELIEFHSLKPGEYLIVPCTNKASSFVITTYSKVEAEME